MGNNQENKGKKKLSKIVIIGIIVLVIIGLGMNSKKKKDAEKSTEASITTTEATTETPATDKSEEASTEASNSEYSFKDNKIVVKDYTIEITDYKVIQPGDEGNKYGKQPVIAFWYKTTNTSGKEITPDTAWIYIIDAVQDNDPNLVNKLNVGMHPDEKLVDNQLSKIKQGGTVENAMSYELTDTETPVVLTAKDSMAGDEIGSQTFEIK